MLASHSAGGLIAGSGKAWRAAGEAVGIGKGAGKAAGVKGIDNVVDGVNIRNAHLAGDVHPVTKIPFNKDGFPDFSSIADKTVEITQTGDRAVDAKLANKAAGLAETPEGFTWHHHENGTTMQLVPKDIHRDTGHTGGVALHKDKCQ